MSKKVIKLGDLLQLQTLIDVGQDSQISVRALSLREMVSLFMEQTEDFVALYAKGLEGDVSIASLTPFLMACPSLVAKVIAVASDEPNNFANVEKNMAATVQLIALQEIWKLSVPDAKKAEELLSGVTALLRKVSEKGREIKEATQKSLVTTP